MTGVTQGSGELFPSFLPSPKSAETVKAAPDDATRPLAERMRPSFWQDVTGQEETLGEGGMLRAALEDSSAHYSFILWGPPGCGKTTIARLFAQKKNARLVALSAIDAGAAELRAAFKDAERARGAGLRTVLVVDEIHRFNKTQQDLFLPYIESGAISLLGATTENPSFALNAALLSRCRVAALRPLDRRALISLAEKAERFVGKPLPLTDEARAALPDLADGDGRYLIGICEAAFDSSEILDQKALARLAAKRAVAHDKTGDAHYNLLSVFHKSLRGSDVDAALYWAARIITAGENPLLVLRRLCAFASEDVGMADPQALVYALAAKDAYQFLGWPEARQALASAITYAALAPKSNAAYKAFDAALADAKKDGAVSPPLHALNAPTALMKAQGYGEGYVYDHDAEDGYAGLDYFPSGMERRQYYVPTERGREFDAKRRLENLERGRIKGG